MPISLCSFKILQTFLVNNTSLFILKQTPQLKVIHTLSTTPMSQRFYNINHLLAYLTSTGSHQLLNGNLVHIPGQQIIY